MSTALASRAKRHSDPVDCRRSLPSSPRRQHDDSDHNGNDQHHRHEQHARVATIEIAGTARERRLQSEISESVGQRSHNRHVPALGCLLLAQSARAAAVTRKAFTSGGGCSHAGAGPTDDVADNDAVWVLPHCDTDLDDLLAKQRCELAYPRRRLLGAYGRGGQSRPCADRRTIGLARSGRWSCTIHRLDVHSRSAVAR